MNNSVEWPKSSFSVIQLSLRNQDKSKAGKRPRVWNFVTRGGYQAVVYEAKCQKTLMHFWMTDYEIYATISPI